MRASHGGRERAAYVSAADAVRQPCLLLRAAVIECTYPHQHPPHQHRRVNTNKNQSTPSFFLCRGVYMYIYIYMFAWVEHLCARSVQLQPKAASPHKTKRLCMFSVPQSTDMMTTREKGSEGLSGIFLLVFFGFFFL